MTWGDFEKLTADEQKARMRTIISCWSSMATLLECEEFTADADEEKHDGWAREGKSHDDH